MSKRELDNHINEQPVTETDGRKIEELLAALPRVEAPANFEFGLKAKIAARNEPRASLIPFVKVAAPLALVLVVGALIVFYATLPGGDDLVVESPAPGKPEVVIKADETQPDVTSEPQIEKPTERIAPQPRNPGPVRRTSPSNRSRGGSIDQPLISDQALRSANVINPPGFGSKSISLPDVLGILGINAEFVDGAWKVRSATTNSAAERSGVRANDILEAIDNHVLTEKTTFKSEFSPKTLRVRRDGKRIQLNLRG
jgi:hypothetical protein